jgi:hypothetical protein
MGVKFGLILREGHILRVSEENIGRKREEVTGGFRTVHNEQLYNLYLLPYVIKVIKSRSMR